MNTICKFLDATFKDVNQGDVVIEDCAAFDEDLNGYVVVCKAHKVEQLMDWAKENLDAKFDMFKRQFDVDPKKAMVFIKAIYKINSYTEDMIEFAGGKEEFINMYRPHESLTDSNADETSEIPSEQPVVSVTEESTPLTGSSDDLAISVNGIEDVKCQDTKQEENAVSNLNTTNESVGGNTPNADFDAEGLMGCISDTEEASAVADDTAEEFADLGLGYATSMPADRKECIQIKEEMIDCNRPCIYNKDGSFKGFTEGEIVTMLNLLKSLDKRIALDTLSPEYILTESEMKESVPTLDAIAPSVYKAFVLYMVNGCSDEMDRIRTSVFLDKFSTFVRTLNGGGLQ